MIIVIQAMLKQVMEILRYTSSASRLPKQRSIVVVSLLLLLALQACTPTASEQDYGQSNVGFSIYGFTYTNDDGDQTNTAEVWNRNSAGGGFDSIFSYDGAVHIKVLGIGKENGLVRNKTSEQLKTSEQKSFLLDDNGSHK